MEPGLIVTIVFGCVAVVGVIIALLTYLKQNPKKRVEYRTTVLPLMQNAAHLSRRLTISFDDKKVQDPHLVKVVVRATGRADVRRSDFDGGLPLEFDLGSGVVPIDDDKSSEVFRLKGNHLQFMPTLMPKKEGEFITTFLCSGRPNIKLNIPHPVADTTIRESLDRTSREDRVISSLTKWAFLAIMIFGFCTSVYLLIK